MLTLTENCGSTYVKILKGSKRCQNPECFLNFRQRLAWRGVCTYWLVTCIFRHGGLISVSLLLKDNVTKLQHGRDHLQHAWQG